MVMWTCDSEIHILPWQAQIALLSVAMAKTVTQTDLLNKGNIGGCDLKYNSQSMSERS